MVHVRETEGPIEAPLPELKNENSHLPSFKKNQIILFVLDICELS